MSKQDYLIQFNSFPTHKYISFISDYTIPFLYKLPNEGLMSFPIIHEYMHLLLCFMWTYVNSPSPASHLSRSLVLSSTYFMQTCNRKTGLFLRPKSLQKVKIKTERFALWFVNVQIVCKTPWTFRPPIYKLPIQAYYQTIYVWNMNISLKQNW